MKKYKEFSPSIDEDRFLDYEKKGPNSKTDDYLIIGFDTEYVSRWINDEDYENDLLSYQWYCQVISSDGTRSKEWSGIVLPNSKEVKDRLTVKEFVELVISDGLSKDKDLMIPRDIFLVCHFTRSDIPGFQDFKDKLGMEILNLSNVRNTFVNMRKDVDIKLGKDLKVRLKIRDTITLTSANSKSLKELGDMLDLPKLDMTLEEIENMDVVMKEQPELFVKYGIRDCEICTKYTVLMIYQYQELTGKFNLPLTLTSIGVDLLTQNWKERGIDQHYIIGKEKRVIKPWNKKLGRPIYKSKIQYLRKLYYSKDFIKESYHGGRNEQFHFGPHKKDVWYDYDLTSCYPSCMSLIGIPEWEKIHYVDDKWFNDPDWNHKPVDLTFLEVEFEFPRSVRFPCLPVRTNHGIIFPRKGISLTHISEILVAKRLGCDIKVLDGRHIPQNRDGFNKDGHRNRVFQEFNIQCVQKREKAKKDNDIQLNYFWKEINNSTYGKLAQGLRDRLVYSIEEDGVESLEESKITNPVFASFITGFARGVLSEIMNNLPKDKIVFSVTTDGFLTNVNPEELKESSKGQLCNYYRDSRNKLVGDDSILEIKHVVGQVLGWRTRGQSTLIKGKSKEYENVVLAKGGIKLKDKLTKETQYPVINDLFFNREPDQVLDMEIKLGIKEMVKKNVDLVGVKFLKRLSMEYDFKRKPLNYGEMKVKGYEPHLIFDTEPWDDIDQFNKVRDLWESYNKTERHCLKTMKDYDLFSHFVREQLGMENIDDKWLSKKDGDMKRLGKELLCSWKHSQGGTNRIKPDCFGEKTRKGQPVFPTYKFTHEQFARILNDHCEIPMTKLKVDNFRFVSYNEWKPHQVPYTKRVMERLKFVKENLFPDLRIEEFVGKESDWNIDTSGKLDVR